MRSDSLLVGEGLMGGLAMEALRKGKLFEQEFIIV